MHEIYLAEKVIKQIEKVAKENNAKKVINIRVVIPEEEHFTSEAFGEMLKAQAQEGVAKEAKFIVIAEDTDKVYIKDIKVK